MACVVASLEYLPSVWRLWRQTVVGLRVWGASDVFDVIKKLGLVYDSALY